MVTEATRLRERQVAPGSDDYNINAGAPRVAAAKDSLAAQLAAGAAAARGAQRHMKAHDMLGIHPLDGLNRDGASNYLEHIYSISSLLATGWRSRDFADSEFSQTVDSIHRGALEALATLAALAHYSLTCVDEAAESAGGAQ